MKKEFKISIAIPLLFTIGILSLTYTSHIFNIAFLATSLFLFPFGLIWAVILAFRWVKTKQNKAIKIALALSPLLFIPIGQCISHFKEEPIFSAAYDGAINGEYLDFYADNTIKYVESSLLGRDIYYGTFKRDHQQIILQFKDRIPYTIHYEESTWELKEGTLNRTMPNSDEGAYYFIVTKGFEE